MLKKIKLFCLSLITFVLLMSCPTPFGILYGDQIIHWDGEMESIEDWIDGEEETTDVTIIIEWPGELRINE